VRHSKVLEQVQLRSKERELVRSKVLGLAHSKVREQARSKAQEHSSLWLSVWPAIRRRTCEPSNR